MNTHALAWAWRQGHRFDNPRVYLTLLALADHAGGSNECFPSRERIAGMIGVTEKGTVTRHVRELERMGLVTRHAEWRSDGGSGANIYILNIGDEDQGGGQPPTGGGEQPRTRGGSPGGTPQEPVVEPVVEPVRKGKGDLAFDPDVVRVWDHYCKLFQPPRAKLGPSRARGIKRALQEVKTVGDLCVAVDGLHENRRHNPRRDSSIEAIWQTYPGSGQSMANRIDWFITQAPRSSQRNPGLPSADPAIVAQHKQNVQRGFHYSQSADAVEQAKESEEWLARHGIETVRRESDGYPIFPGPGDAPTPESE